MKKNRNTIFRMRNFDQLEMNKRPKYEKEQWKQLDHVMFNLQVVQVMHKQTNLF